ncbi:hypothetical protein [aff. Roholtiella sp. LEGE 12411]|uniref:hypothetical protein n=1 Tax=aff. Roholtiella sp. LEGE 12411 TaxID=1828822 RepID=UPI001880CBEF|nr:hypothetical protein [aff. Roholtiella sp. LEGE 12411]MBE9036563.1 hypothetical protein [aff. Roholtiella sp. LEGE 12411]
MPNAPSRRAAILLQTPGDGVYRRLSMNHRTYASVIFLTPEVVQSQRSKVQKTLILERHLLQVGRAAQRSGSP